VAVAGVGAVVADGSALVVAQVVRHFDLQGALDQHLSQLLQQAIFANQVFL
jgi:hypothetical protein